MGADILKTHSAHAHKLICLKISLEIVTFGQIAIAQFFLACGTSVVHFGNSLSNFSAITQSNA